MDKYANNEKKICGLGAEKKQLLFRLSLRQGRPLPPPQQGRLDCALWGVSSTRRWTQPHNLVVGRRKTEVDERTAWEWTAREVKQAREPENEPKKRNGRIWDGQQ